MCPRSGRRRTLCACVSHGKKIALKRWLAWEHAVCDVKTMLRQIAACQEALCHFLCWKHTHTHTQTHNSCSSVSPDVNIFFTFYTKILISTIFSYCTVRDGVGGRNILWALQSTDWLSSPWRVCLCDANKGASNRDGLHVALKKPGHTRMPLLACPGMI